MTSLPRLPVLLLPGGVTPAAHAFVELESELGSGVRTIRKDHELFAGPTPPPGWDLRMEADACAALVRGLPEGRAHVVGFSLGAEITLRLLARHGELVASAALIEPEWIGERVSTPAEEQAYADARALASRDPAAAMKGFLRSLVAPGVAPPTLPGGPSPPWMASRLAVLPLLLGGEPDAFDLTTLRAFAGPVMLACGEHSAPRFGRASRRVAEELADATIEIYPGSHHANGPHRHSPKRFAAAAMDLWRRSEAASPA